MSVVIATCQPSFSRPNEVGARDADVLEEYLVELGVARHLDERTHRDPGAPHVDQQVGDAEVLPRRGVGAAQQDAPVGAVREARPDLLAVYDVVLAVGDGARLQRGEVGAGVRLRVALAPDLLGGEHGRNEAALLLLAAPLHERRADHHDTDRVDRLRRVRASHLLGVDELPQERRAAAAVLARPVDPHPVAGVHGTVPGEELLEALVGILLLVELSGAEVPREIVGEPGAQLRAERLLLGRVAEVHRRQGARPALSRS